MAKLTVVQLLRKNNSLLDKDKAQALVICRNVYVNGELCPDPKQMFPSDSTVEISYPKYVSRGGFKLEKAIEFFRIDVKGKCVLDAGSSTGGFSDCLLQNGAAAVHCVDVGYNLLDFKIRSNKNVYVHEKTNIMALESLEPVPDFAVADLSFRSIRGVASHILNLTSARMLVALIKPQFEVPKWQENFDGVITDPALLKQTLENVHEILSNESIGISGAVMSPIKGHKGNTEFLALLTDENKNSLSVHDFIRQCGIDDQGGVNL